MLKKASIPWNARQLSKMIDNGNVVFDSSVQRGLVWDDKRKSLLIHSMLEEYPIPVMYAAKDESKHYSFLDGKQRSNCIYDYLHDKFKLVDVSDVTMEDETIVDINGKLFSELDEELQDTINSYSLTIHYFEGITDDEVAELFFRINNGKPLSAIEMSRVKAKSLTTIQEIGKHELFNTSLTDKAFERYTHEDIVIKAYIMLTETEPCLDTKAVRPIMENAEFTEENINDLNAVFDMILNVYKFISEDDNKETEKKSKKIAKRIITRTHLLSVVPLINRLLKENTSEDVITEWLRHFFNGTKAPTNYAEYNNRCTSGSGHAESVRIRLEVIEKDYNKFVVSREESLNVQ